MKINVTRRFRDMDVLTHPDRKDGDGDPVHEAGATLTVSKDRGDDLVRLRFATEATPTASAKPAKRTKAPVKNAKPAVVPLNPVTEPPTPAPTDN